MRSWEFLRKDSTGMKMDELKKWDEKGVDELVSTEFKPKENEHTLWDNVKSC